MAESSIEWTDVTWNPVTGCTRVSAGCDHCYAVRMSYRLEKIGQRQKYGGLTVLNGKGDRHFNGQIRTHEDVLTLPLKWRKPRQVFVNSMSDLFHKDVPFDFIDKVFAIMALTPHHTYQVLTKRPDRVAQYLSSDIGGPAENGSTRRRIVLEMHTRNAPPAPQAWRDASAAVHYGRGWPLPNVWLGTSVENQQAADERIPHLLKCPAAVRFLSCEPLLGPIDLSGINTGHYFSNPLNGRRWHDADDACSSDDGGKRIHWVIAGGESGPGARPMHPAWARSLRDQCVAASVPFFFKQWGEWRHCDEIDRDTYMENVNRHKWMAGPGNGYLKFGKAKAGRILDGRTWNEMPKPAGVANGNG